MTWENSAERCINDAKAMIDGNVGVIGNIKDKSEILQKSSRSSYTRVSFEKMSSKFIIMLNNAIRKMIYIKSRPFGKRHLKLNNEDMGT